MVDLTVFDRIKTKDDFDREEREFLLKKMQSKGNVPAALQLTNEYLAAKQSGDIDRANAIEAFAKTHEKNVYYDPETGAYIPLPGMPGALSQLEYGKQAGTEMAKTQYEPTRTGLNQQAEKGVDLVMNPQISSATKAADIRTENQVNAQTNLPKAEAHAQQIQKILGDIENAPGLSASVGMPNILKGRVPFIGDFAGSPAADFTAKLEQLKGTQFLEAFQTLKGGGAITEVEGVKAENAIARMQTSQSEKEFKKALNEFKGIVAQALDRERAKAGAPPKLDPRNIPMQAVQYLRENPHTAAQFDEMYGAGASRMVIGK